MHCMSNLDLFRFSPSDRHKLRANELGRDIGGFLSSRFPLDYLAQNIIVDGARHRYYLFLPVCPASLTCMTAD